MGALATHSELIVMRGAGLSLLRLVGGAMGAGLVLSLLVTLIGEYIAPASERLAKTHSFAARTGHEVLYRGYDFWARDGNFLISIGAAEPGPVLIDIWAYQLDDQGQLVAVAYARRARYQEGRWLLEEIEQRTIRPDAITRTEIPKIAWESVITPRTLEVLTADPEDLAMRELLTYIDYLEDNGLDTRRYQLAFWTKLLAPLANLSMLFIAMPFAFGRQRSAGMGQRLVIGILLGLAFFLLNRMLGNIVLLYDFPPIIGAALPMVLFYGAGALALSRLR
jgi:lipopolysaccharide export system permease protein